MVWNKFTPVRGKQLEQRRIDAKDGKLDRELRARTIIPERYADAIWANPDNILGMPYLVRDIQGFKKVLKALKKTACSTPEALNLLDKLTLRQSGEEFTSPLCPLARHRRKRNMHRGIEPFLFDGVRNQIRFETIIHGFSPTLEGTLDIIEAARKDFLVIQTKMNRRGTGYLEVGTFEPDIRHSTDFSGGLPVLTKLASKLQWDVPDAGGYVVSSHRLVRVARPWVYRNAVRKQFPGYRRIKSERLTRSKSIAQDLDQILDYIWKLDPHINAIREIPSRDSVRIMQSIFAGPTTTGKSHGRYVYETMLTQWALFQDRVGFETFEINYINSFSYDWHTEEEVKFFMESEWYDEIHGYSKVEPVRSGNVDRFVRHDPSDHVQALPLPKPYRLWAAVDDAPKIPKSSLIAHIAGQPVLQIFGILKI